MVTPRLPSVTTTFAPRPTPVPQRGEDVVYIVGPYKQAVANAQAQIIQGPYRTVTALESGPVGDGGLVHDAAVAVLSQIDVPVYTVGTLVAAGDTIPTAAQTLAALAVIRGRPPAEVPTLILAPGQTAGTDGNATAASTVISDATNGLAAVAAAYGALAIADAPQDTTANMITWAGNNLTDRVVGAANYAVQGGANIPFSGPATGAIAAHTQRYGRAAGLNLAPVTGISGLEHDIGHTPRVAAGTVEANLVAAWLLVGVNRAGSVVLVGQYVKNTADDARRYISVQRVVDHVEHLMEETGEDYLATHSLATPAEVAGATERAARALVPTEIAGIVVSVNEAAQTPAADTAGEIHLYADIELLIPRSVIRIQATIGV